MHNLRKKKRCLWRFCKRQDEMGMSDALAALAHQRHSLFSETFHCQIYMHSDTDCDISFIPHSPLPAILLSFLTSKNFDARNKRRTKQKRTERSMKKWRKRKIWRPLDGKPSRLR